MPSFGCGAGGDSNAQTTCAVGQVECAGVCVNLDSDGANCGSCSRICAPGLVCSLGYCASTCAEGYQLCGSSCVDAASDPSHCGGCDAPCATGQACTASLCTGGEAVSSGGSSSSATSATGGSAIGTGGSDSSSGGSAIGTGGSGGATTSQFDTPAPSNAAADCEAKTLLDYLYGLMGSQTLSGQESMFSDGGFASSRDRYVQNQVQKYPALYSSDFGDVATNNLGNRQDVVNNAIAYAAQGSIIQLHYHMIQPDQPDGAGFNTMGNFSQSNRYSSSNIDQILTDGSQLNREHLRRLDELAGYLGQLRDRGIPVLWRPFHEMNGDWFWWGQQARFRDLWIQMWEYLTTEHDLTNLLWVFSVNHFTGMGGGYGLDQYYPGHQYVDVLGVDVYLEYGHNYDQYVHEELMRLGGGKPIAFTENGQMPPLSSMSSSQPNWVYWATWWGFEGNDHGNSSQLYSSNYGLARVLTQDEVNVPSCP